MTVPSSNATLATTVSIRYMGCIGKPTAKNLLYPFEIPEQAPLSLCDRPPFRESDPNPDATGQFLTLLIERHNTQPLFARAWRCEVCKRPAREFYYSAVPHLLHGEGAKPEFVPWVWDTIVPICRSGGACDRQAGEWAGAFGKEAMPTLQVGTKCCQVCGKVTAVKLCRGCRVLA